LKDKTQLKSRSRSSGIYCRRS